MQEKQNIHEKVGNKELKESELEEFSVAGTVFHLEGIVFTFVHFSLPLL